jgi:hypothetical protein
MEPAWYFMNGATRTGPLSTEELVTALLATPEPRLTKVWREGLSDWERAGGLPELKGKLPPRATSTSSPPDDRELPATGQPTQVGSQARAVASLYRRLVLLIGVQLIIGIGVKLIDQEHPSDLEAIIGLIGFLCALVVVGLIVVTAYRLMKELGSGAPILWALAMFIPLLNILFLLAISSKAQAWCKERGIAVGFLGPTRESLDRLSAGPRGTA